MENGDIKVCKMQARKVAQDVLMYVWFKNEVIPGKPKPELSFVPEITVEFLNNLCVLVWIESYRNEYVWGDFLRNHFKRMTRTPYLFANYFAYASYILIEKATDAHACFFDILSLVTHFALYCWEKEDKFLNSCVDLFCAFFDKEICSKFEDQGRWKNFNEYLKNQRNLKRCKELIGANKPPFELFKPRDLESNEPYVINDVVLKDITANQVENHKKAVIFADSVADKMKEVCNKAFEELLKDFPKTENQVEELYRETVGVASGGMASSKDQSFSQEVQEEALENVPSKTNPAKIEDLMNEYNASDSLETRVISSLKSRDLSPAPKELDLSPKLTKAEMAKALLKEMMTDIEKISELIKFVCEENSIKAPIQVVDIVTKL